MIGWTRIAAPAAALVLLTTLLVSAHEEPPQTARERAEQERQRARMMTLGVERQEVWQITEADSTGARDSVLWYCNEYDAEGNLVTQLVYDSAQVTRSVSKYNDNHVWLEEAAYSNDSLEDRTVFTCDQRGLISRIVSLDGAGAVIGRLEYAYADADARIDVVKYDGRDSVEYRLAYHYEQGGANDRLIEIVQTNPDGSMRMKVRNEYRDSLRVRKSVCGADGRQTHAFLYTYTDNGDFREITRLGADDSVDGFQRFDYTDSGLPLSFVASDSLGAVSRELHYQYRFRHTQR